jgi:hypothetical protein
MEHRSSPLHLVFRHAFRAIAKVWDVARRAGPVAILCLTVLTLGVACLTRNTLTRAWARITGYSNVSSLSWWPTQSVHAQGALNFTIFDAPGAGTGMLQGTMGTSINASGDIAGIYLTAPNVAHGFVRTVVSGTPTFATFNAPGAGTSLNQGTFPASINTAGDVAGMYFDSNNAYHGFVRVAATGSVTPIDVPGAPTNIGHRGTLPISMNAGGDITGFYVDANDVRHGFLRAAATGTITAPIDAPGAGTGLTQGTVPLSIDAAGNITGFYNANGTFHGFIRASNGTITAPINAPGAGTGPSGKVSFMGTLPLAFDAAGDIAGTYADASGVNHGFTYTAASATPAFTTFNAPGAGTTGFFPGTGALNMNAGGDTSGIYTDTNGVRHGFFRAAAGTITAPIDAPGATTTGLFSGTILTSINTADDITGTFADTNGVFHAFVLALGQSGAATPSFSPPAGTYSSPQMVTISDATAGATIYYTTDGSTPTTASTVFTAPITVNTTETIKAIATATGLANSAVATAVYTIATPAATPTFSVPSGTYTSVQMVTISDTTAGATIFYTTDGSTPSTASTPYTGTITVNATETIKAIATATGFANSAVATATYTINLPAPDFQLSVNPSTLTIVAGQSGTATFTVTPKNGFNSQVSFACSGLPSEAACSFSPTSVTPSGAAVTSTLTVTTTAKSATMRMPMPSSQRPAYALLFPVLAMIFGIAARRRQVPYGLQLLGVLMLLMLASGLASCGGGSAGNPGTPLGTSMVSVSASSSGGGAISHTATLTITITH